MMVHKHHAIICWWKWLPHTRLGRTECSYEGRKTYYNGSIILLTPCGAVGGFIGSQAVTSNEPTSWQYAEYKAVLQPENQGSCPRKQGSPYPDAKHDNDIHAWTLIYGLAVFMQYFLYPTVYILTPSFFILTIGYPSQGFRLLIKAFSL